MAFNERPQIDASAEHDQQAKIRLTGLLSETYGFRARESHPDNGVDFVVELVVDSGATHWYFGAIYCYATSAN